MYAISGMQKHDRDFFSGSKKLDRHSNRARPQIPNPAQLLQRSLGNTYEQSVTTLPQIVGASLALTEESRIRRTHAYGGLRDNFTEREEHFPRIQAKLVIGPPGDIYEQEADRIAEQVVRMPGSLGQDKNNRKGTGLHIQRIARNNGTLETTEDLELNTSGGQPLSSSMRQFMEPRFGADFGHIRLHTDHDAHHKASQIQARAFTYGRDIWLGKGESEQDKRLMAHELTHVVQQGSVLQRKSVVDQPNDLNDDNRETVRTPEEGDDVDRQTGVLRIQRDFAIEPPNPTANPSALTHAEVQDAIRYNTAKLRSADAALLSTVRDVLGISRNPPVIDEDFVNAVARWQVVNNILPADGKLGPDTAAPLFRELRAEGLSTESRTLASLVRRGRVRTGPTYTPHGVVAAPAGAGRHVPFAMAAEFEHDPLNGIWASCCEVRQEIQWNAAMAASFAATGDPVPHGGFPAVHPADRRIEDRNDTDTIRYGHRTGFGGGVGGNRYLNAAGNLDQANGRTFEGHDDPHMFPADHGRMIFTLSVVDVCNENRRIGGTDTITIDW